MEYQNLLKMLKVYANNIQILHRHVVGSNWFSTHKLLEDYYEHVQADLDSLVEVGLSIEIDEPTLLQSLDSYKELEIKNRSVVDSYKIVIGYFNDIIAQINRVEIDGEVSNDAANLLQEKQTYYRVEANYKIFRATIEDDDIE